MTTDVADGRRGVGESRRHPAGGAPGAGVKVSISTNP